MKKSLAKFALFLIVAAVITTGCSAPSDQNKNTASTNKSNTPVLQTTPTCDDAEITSLLEKTYSSPPFAADSMYFNYFSKGCVVTLYGGVSSASIRQQAILAAEDTKGVSKVITDKFYPNTTTTSKPIPGSCACPDGYKPCGDICIPNGDQCNIKGETCKKITATTVPGNKAP
ncbi:MAG TPA: BON domain-containing protein [Pyrinomonadaceae bacterium]|nr:BON domain-containing protein [Acidobacteriota bacterium]HQZ96758.1 BON domain-containing protein [Pyrinomonadaceae bacterium]